MLLIQNSFKIKPPRLKYCIKSPDLKLYNCKPIFNPWIYREWM